MDFSRAGTLARLLLVLPLAVLASCRLSEPRTEASSRPAATPPPPYRVERGNQDLPADATLRLVKIVNPHGSVVLKQTNAPTVGFHRVVQLIGATPEAPDIRFVRNGDTIELVVSYASDATRGEEQLVDGYRKGRVDATLFVPPGPSIDVRTNYGDIQARRINNDLVASSRTGRVMGAGGGAMSLRSDSGIVRAFPTASKWNRPFEIETVSGDILVEIREPVAVRFEATTGGQIRGWPGVESVPGGSSLAFGAGVVEQEMRVRSKTGNIDLVRVPGTGNP